MKTHRQAAFDALSQSVQERGTVKGKDIEALKEIVTKGGKLTEKGAARLRDFYDRFSRQMNKDERAAVKALLASGAKTGGMEPAASVRVEPGVSKMYPYVTIKGLVPDGTNTKPRIDIEQDKDGNLTVIIGVTSKGGPRGPIKDANQSFERELELWKHTDKGMFKARFVDPLGNELARPMSYDRDDDD